MRAWLRADAKQFHELIHMGLVEPVGEKGLYRITPAGEIAADMGEIACDLLDKAMKAVPWISNQAFVDGRVETQRRPRSR